jgi:transposase
MKVSTIGVDIAKSVFQVHGEDAEGKAIVQKRLGRQGMVGFFSKLPPCLVALEACGTSHYWGRALRTMGHEVRLIPAAYVKPFVKRNKTDARRSALRPGGRTCARLRSRARSSRRRGRSSARASC